MSAELTLERARELAMRYIELRNEGDDDAADEVLVELLKLLLGDR